jgi:hypothetical protein
VGKVNVYLPDDLERAVRDAGVPVSAVCQAALRSAVEGMARVRTGGAPPLTPRLVEVLQTAPATALELLGAILLHGENLGARVVADLGVELPPPRRARKGATRPKAAAAGEVREALVAAYRVALELQHGYVGTEHVVIALAKEGSPVVDLFAALGIDDRAVHARVQRLLANPWSNVRDADRTAPPPEVFDRFEAELRRMSAELQAMRSSAKLPPWPPTTSS